MALIIHLHRLVILQIGIKSKYCWSTRVHILIKYRISCAFRGKILREIPISFRIPGWFSKRHCLTWDPSHLHSVWDDRINTAISSWAIYTKSRKKHYRLSGVNKNTTFSLSIPWKCILKARKVSTNIYIHNNKNKCKVTRITISSSTANNAHDNDIKQIQHKNNTYSSPSRHLTNKDNLTQNHMIFTSNSPNKNYHNFAYFWNLWRKRNLLTRLCLYKTNGVVKTKNAVVTTT